MERTAGPTQRWTDGRTGWPISRTVQAHSHSRLQTLALRTTRSNSSSQRPLRSATVLFRFRSQESGANDMGWQLHIWGGSELVTHFCWAQISESFWSSAKSAWKPLSAPQCSQGCVTRGAREYLQKISVSERHLERCFRQYLK